MLNDLLMFYLLFSAACSIMSLLMTRQIKRNFSNDEIHQYAVEERRQGSPNDFLLLLIYFIPVVHIFVFFTMVIAERQIKERMKEKIEDSINK